MTFAGINHLAVLIAAVLAWLASAAWCLSLGKHYADALGKTPVRAFGPYLLVLIIDLLSLGCSPACSVISARAK